MYRFIFSSFFGLFCVSTVFAGTYDLHYNFEASVCNSRGYCVESKHRHEPIKIEFEKKDKYQEKRLSFVDPVDKFKINVAVKFTQSLEICGSTLISIDPKSFGYPSRGGYGFRSKSIYCMVTDDVYPYSRIEIPGIPLKDGRRLWIRASVEIVPIREKP